MQQVFSALIVQAMARIGNHDFQAFIKGATGLQKRMARLSRHIAGRVRSPGRAMLQTMRMITGARQLIVLGSAHKVGSTWLYRLLLDLCSYNPFVLPADVVDRHPDKLPVDIDLESVLNGIVMPSGGYVYKTHSFPPDRDPAALPAWAKFVTLLRDPRDVIVSSCFYLTRIPSEKGGWGEQFSNLDERKRIINIIENGDFLRLRLRKWNQCSYAYKVRYERLLSEPLEELQGLLTFLEINAGKKKVGRVCRKHAFKKQTGRNRGEEDKLSFLRKGISGDWRNYFDEEVIKAFKHACDGDWNELLLELGYEETRDW